MLSLTPLERAALSDIGERYPDDRVALEAQLRTAVARSRTNTGAGFYTYLDVDPASPSIGGALRMGGWTTVEGFDDPMGFILWLKNGYADHLEGFTVRDSTTAVDLSQANFSLPFFGPTTRVN
jgi:hypothetical protein